MGNKESNTRRKMKVRFHWWYIPIILGIFLLTTLTSYMLRKVRQYSFEYGFQPELILAIIQVESSFNPLARSKNKDGSTNARGLMQLERDAWNDAVAFSDLPYNYDNDAYKIAPNIHVGISYLAWIRKFLFTRLSNLTVEDIVRAYYSGVGTVIKNRNADQFYVERVRKALGGNSELLSATVPAP